MTSGALIADVVLTFCLAAGILYKYGNIKKQNGIVTFAVLIAWYFSFLIIFVLPLDVSNTVYRQCVEAENSTDVNTTSTCKVPWSHVPDTVFPNLWRIVYWTSQFLTWLILPLMQSYAKAGEFTVRGKLKSALVDNAIYYGSYLFICGVLLIYIAVKPGLQLDGQKIKAIASSASNTWGLLLLVGLLGYALVEIPRSLWLSATPGYRLQRAYFKVAKISVDKSEAEETLDDVLESIQSMASCVRPRDPLYAEMETVIQKVPQNLLQKNKIQSAAAHADSMVSPTLKSLVRIHKQLIKALHTSKRCETQWQLALQKVILLEDIQRNRHSNMRTFKHTFANTPALFSPTFEWYWRCMMQDYIYRAGAVICGLLSAMVVWSELTFFNKSPVLSLFAVFLNLARDTYDYFTIEVMGHMVVLSIISDGFNIYFPMAVLAFCLATYFSLGSRLLSLIGFQQFLDDDELTAELVDEGRELVSREKRKRQRSEETAERRREYQERFGSQRQGNQDRDTVISAYRWLIEFLVVFSSC
ncbi:unnamed protein product [Nesidiocoris tenuis]|uniref:LMBR1 domain-containing protein 2 homolog n=1 Tax=Nesidiocoris tenuis TaxID=355587 RepID=A0A6H5HHG6_9HEMI|nr:unnamed protein product [Nesidiocoris tenuis]